MTFAEKLFTNLDYPRVTVTGVVDDAIPLAIGGVLDCLKRSGCLFVARDGQRLSKYAANLKFWLPEAKVLSVPAWDCQPYDRVSPHVDIMAKRLNALSELGDYHLTLEKRTDSAKPFCLMTSVNALLQRVPSRKYIAKRCLFLVPGQSRTIDDLGRWFSDNGFLRVDIVREKGEFAIRGGIIDAFPSGLGEPVRIDFFGNSIDSLRNFNPESQLSSRQLHNLKLTPAGEILLDAQAVALFKSAYTKHFGFSSHNDSLYAAISEQRRFPGMEHWGGFFIPDLETIFDYLPGMPVVFDNLAHEAIRERVKTIDDYYQDRVGSIDQSQGNPYRPAPPNGLYLTDDELSQQLANTNQITLNGFDTGDPQQGTLQQGTLIDLNTRSGRNFAPERGAGQNVYDAATAHINDCLGDGQRVVLTSHSGGSLSRLRQIILDHGGKALIMVDNALEMEELGGDKVACAILDLDRGFCLAGLAIIDEQDIIGSRFIKIAKRRVSKNAIKDALSLNPGDLIVHLEHGIGRFAALKTLTVSGYPHDFFEITYAGFSKLYLPVENGDLLALYGSGDGNTQLDKLGSSSWQGRKARAKKRIRAIATVLINTAAKRYLQKSPIITPPSEVWDEFCARFLYAETEDQLGAIEAVMGDLTTGRPMDRLICGDVGFGKTEIALRAAFAVAMNGYQVAVLVPTTLLARQHYKTFSERFKGFPLRTGHASRLVGPKVMRDLRTDITQGTMDVAIGTHALLTKKIKFARLGLLVIDEEQRFGVAHKERLKELKANINVLTMTATPIPRTMQLAFSGVRDLSLITAAPNDRLAVRTYIGPFDRLIVREALLRERFRGGQVYYVVPRIADLTEVMSFLDEQVPELKVVIAHGQLPATRLDDIMSAFYDGTFDVLLSTSIVESGLDNPRANTLVVHRCDRFGLAQLHQLRGRVGRAKLRAYALFTFKDNQKLTPVAEKRLQFLNSLDSLGAGFQLAGYDLDQRGAGNLLGEEQSGHIREVGFELYQSMLEEEIKELRGEDIAADSNWSPQIVLDMPVLIPESYIPDLGLRLNLYRRLANISDSQEIAGFAAEMIDRFGKLPEETEQLFKLALIKGLCKRGAVSRLEVGPRGVVVAFRNDQFANPQGLIAMINDPKQKAKFRPDNCVVFLRQWSHKHQRIKGVTVILQDIVDLAEK